MIPDASAPLVVLVDDDEDVRRITRRMLGASGYDVRDAASGEAALQLLQTMTLQGERPALLVTDMRMPGMPGPRLAHAARVVFPRLPVLFISGAPEDHETPIGQGEDGVDAVLGKPFGAEALRSAVRILLASAGGASQG